MDTKKEMKLTRQGVRDLDSLDNKKYRPRRQLMDCPKCDGAGTTMEFGGFGHEELCHECKGAKKIWVTVSSQRSRAGENLNDEKDRS